MILTQKALFFILFCSILCFAPQKVKGLTLREDGKEKLIKMVKDEK